MVTFEQGVSGLVGMGTGVGAYTVARTQTGEEPTVGPLPWWDAVGIGVGTLLLGGAAAVHDDDAESFVIAGVGMGLFVPALVSALFDG